MTQMKAKLIMNPKAGKMKSLLPPLLKLTFTKFKTRSKGMFTPPTKVKDIIEAVTEECERANIKLDIEFTKYPKHAIKIAEDSRNEYDLLIVAGGDGTVNEVINGIANSRTTLAIIPFGTSNDLALELGIPSNAKEAAELITEGRQTKIDLGHPEVKEGSRFYSIVLTVGFDAAFMNKDTTSEFRNRWGILAEPIMGINLITCRWQKLQIEHTTNSIGYFVIIANSKFIGGEYQVANAASTTDGLLDLVILNRKWWNVLPLLFSAYIGKRNKFQQNEYYQIEEAYVYGMPDMLVQADSEIIGTAPVKVAIAPKALNVIANKVWQT
jgi:YegS/Rv2252/BmrU family lipid kinase